jgi:hypothetical protein
MHCVSTRRLLTSLQDAPRPCDAPSPSRHLCEVASTPSRHLCGVAPIPISRPCDATPTPIPLLRCDAHSHPAIAMRRPPPPAIATRRPPNPVSCELAIIKIKPKGMTCDPTVNSAATGNNPVRGCTSQHAVATGHRVEHLRRSVIAGKRVLLICYAMGAHFVTGSVV